MNSRTTIRAESKRETTPLRPSQAQSGKKISVRGEGRQQRFAEKSGNFDASQRPHPIDLVMYTPTAPLPW